MITRPASSRITEEDVRAGRARLVTRKGYVMAEWAPPGTQLRIPMPDRARRNASSERS